MPIEAGLARFSVVGLPAPSRERHDHWIGTPSAPQPTGDLVAVQHARPCRAGAISMDIDLRGRVNNTKLTPTNCLLPLFEAIINSIHAIEEKGKIRGSIEITIERDRSQGLLEAEHLPLAAGP